MAGGFFVVSDPFAACAALIRRADPDRYLSALFAPAERRPYLHALYAFNHELAHAGESVSEPMVGEIRLQWWREALETARGDRLRPHDVVRALAATFAQNELPAALFEAMIDARSIDVSRAAFPDDAARDAYLDATSGGVMRLAARILGAEDRFDDLAHEAGLAYGIAGLLRNRRIAATPEARADARGHLALARRMKKPRRALAAFLPATLVPLYLRDPAKDVPIHRRQIALLGGALRGRI